MAAVVSLVPCDGSLPGGQAACAWLQSHCSWVFRASLSKHSRFLFNEEQAGNLKIGFSPSFDKLTSSLLRRTGERSRSMILLTPGVPSFGGRKEQSASAPAPAAAFGAASGVTG